MLGTAGGAAVGVASVPSALKVTLVGRPPSVAGVPVVASAKVTVHEFEVVDPAAGASFFIVTLTGWALPRVSYMVICDVTCVPVTASADRLPPIAAPVVGTGVSTCPVGIFRSASGPLA